MARGTRGRRGKSGKGKGLSGNADPDLTNGEVTLGIEKGAIGASITFTADTIKISLGIGVMAVELDLGELNNSKVSYAFDLYEIEGTRDGCSVTLRYKMAGHFIKSETRRIPDCKNEDDDDDRKRPNDDEEDDSNDNSGTNGRGSVIPKPRGGLWDRGYWLVGTDINLQRTNVRYYRGLWSAGIREQRVSVSAKILEVRPGSLIWERTSSIYLFRDYYFQPYAIYDGLLHREGFPHITRFDGDAATITNRFYKDTEVREERSTLTVGHNQRAIRCSTGALKYYLERHELSDGEMITKIDSYGGFSDSAEGSYVTKILDEKIIERKFPARGGASGTDGIIDRKNRKRGKGMDSKCCEMVKRLYSIFAVKELQDEGFNIPKKWYAPNAKGVKKLTNYLEILEYQMRMLDHYGISPFKFKLADTDLVKKGNQGAEIQTINGTDAIQQILENTSKNDTSNQALIKILGSIIIALAEIAVTSSSGTRVAEEILQALGVPLSPETFTMNLPFNIKALLQEKPVAKNKSTSSNQQSNLKLNLTEEANTLVPKMMQPGKQQYTIETFNDDYPTLSDLLIKANSLLNSLEG